MKHSLSQHNISLESFVFSDILTPIIFEPPDNSTLPIKSGWLEKRSTGLVKRWTNRFFTLESQELKYYYSESKEKLGGVINFNIVTAEISVNKRNIVIRTIGGKREFNLRAVDEKEAIDWGYIISLNINSANGRKTVFSVAEKKQFWKFPRISEEDFKYAACTGDILLFRGNDFVSKMQRLVTVSQYDHVAFILKYPNGKLSLLEATSAEGVSILSWDEFKFYRFEQLYERLIYRKIEFDRSDARLLALEQFIFKVHGKKYRISAGKLMTKKIDKDPGHKRGFFCSELVAMALKVLGLLPQFPPASRYWPGDFSDSKKLELLNEAVIKPGELIDFEI